jgi:hypothetical protein
MLAVRKQFALYAMLLSLCCVSMTLRAQDAQAPQQPQGGPEQIEPPPSIPAELPPGPVIVSYQNGQLMIEAMNATLSSVLRAACYQTGTALEIPTGAEERLLGVFGPRPARELFTSLLNGSRFNYVMEGTTDDESRVVRLTLFVKPVASLNVQPVPSTPKVIAKAVELPNVAQSSQPVKQAAAQKNVADQPAPQLTRPRRRRR